MKRPLVKITRSITRKVSENFTFKYTRLVLWLFGHDSDQYFLLAKRIDSQKKNSGIKHTTLYLKECVRLVQHWKSGYPTVCIPHSVRVASKRGLPKIIPGKLRLSLERQDPDVLRIILTILSIYRVFKFPSLLKLETITDPFQGISKTLPAIEVGVVWTRFTKFLPSMKVGRTNLLPLRSAGPNYKISVLGAPLDALAWANASDGLRNSFKFISDYFSSSLWDKLLEEIEVSKKYTPKKELLLGKLSLKTEPAGKIRVFAIVDVWTQSVLEPIHKGIYELLRNIPQDGTFDQSAPLILLQSKLKAIAESNKGSIETFSFDLSAATDRLPIDIQVQVMSQLFNREVAEAWKCLLTDRSYRLKNEDYKYAVGQPMGALSSFGMLALTHHFIIQMAASRAGFRTWFDMYAILGDDVVIADKAVAAHYHNIMAEVLGVKINDFKSLKSPHGVMEFAKRLVSPWSEYTPIGPNNIAGVLKHPGNIPGLFLDLFNKGGSLNWNVQMITDRLNSLSHNLVKLSKGGKEALQWCICGPFGFIKSNGFAPETETNSLLDSHWDDMLAYQSQQRQWMAASLEELPSEEELCQKYSIDDTLEETILYFYSKDWDSAFDRTLASTLGLFKKESHDSFEEAPTPLVFPSYRAQLYGAIGSLIEILEKIPKRSNEFYQLSVIDSTDLLNYGVLQDRIKSVPSVLPVEDPWMKPKPVKTMISRHGVEFFRRMSLIAKELDSQTN